MKQISVISPAYRQAGITPMIFDAHTHIHFPAYDQDREAVIKRAIEAGVKMITVGTQTSSSESAVKLACEYPQDIWATVGFHPNHVVDLELQEENRIKNGASHTEALAKGASHTEALAKGASHTEALAKGASHTEALAKGASHTEALAKGASHTEALAKVWHHDENEQEANQPEKFDIEFLRKLAHDPKVVAIGECGLDYYRLSQNSNLKSQIVNQQKEVFIKQAELANEAKKALMIHCRASKGTDDAYTDLLAIIHNSKFIIPKILHFYAGGMEVTRKFIDAGFYFTFGGVITFARDYDEIIKTIPLDRILLETDAPYVAPLAYRGKRNEPSFIMETAKKMAEIKSVSYDKIVDVTSENTKKAFKIIINE